MTIGALRRLRRYWLIALLIVAMLAVVVVRWGSDYFTQPSPNYTEIEPGLYMGGLVSQPPPGTRAVLNLCEIDDSYRNERYRWEPIHDSEPAPGLDWLRNQVAFVEQALSAGETVYIHCRAGISRSGMVVAAYYVAKNHWSRDQALEFIRNRRLGVRPNPAFMKLLTEWEESINSRK